MYYNNKFIDNILKSNIKQYLLDIIEYQGYTIFNNTDIIGNKSFLYKDTDDESELDIISDDSIKDIRIKFLKFDKNNLNEYQNKIVSDEKLFINFINLQIFLKKDYDTLVIKKFYNNLSIESLESTILKIKIFAELLKVLGMNSIADYTKKISKRFLEKIDSEWISENSYIILKTFNLRASKKYEDMSSYYTIYLLSITVFKNLFDDDLIIRDKVQIKKMEYFYYNYNNNDYIDHLII